MSRTIFEQIGEKISTWLQKEGKSQNYLAERMGVSKQVMSKIINGKKSINIVEIQKIAQIMNVSIDELLGHSTGTNSIQDPIMFMIGNLKNDKTKEKLHFLDHVMDEMIELERIIKSH